MRLSHDNALDQSARVVDSTLQKRLIAGSIASNCYVVPALRNYFRQNADLLDYGYCIRRQYADNTRVRQAQREPQKAKTG
jgi:hypothetical protein